MIILLLKVGYRLLPNLQHSTKQLCNLVVCFGSLDSMHVPKHQDQITYQLGGMLLTGKK